MKKLNITTALSCALLLLAAALLFPAPAAAQNVKVEGVLTDEGVECPALRDDNNTLYTLTPRSAVEGFQVGDRVRVTGRVATVSFCQQGTTLEVVKIKPAKDKNED